MPLPVPGSQPGASSPPDASPVPGAAPSRPSGRPSAPAPTGIAPPPGLSKGIPLPPFQRPAAQAAAKPSAAQQTIKVEVGEEVEAERRKLRKQAILYASLTGLLGLAIGLPIGCARESSKRGQMAVQGAAALEGDVKAANAVMKELSDKLNGAAEQLGKKSYPTEFSTELGAINVPFDAFNLEGKQVGSLPGKVLRQVLAYTSAVQDLNKTKDSLKNLLAAAKAPVEKSWVEEKEPVASFSVVFRRDNNKTLAELVPNKEPFPFKKDWPEKYKVTRLQRTQQGMKEVEKEVARWTKGDPTSGSDLNAMPVDPQTVAKFTSEQIVFKLASAMREIRQSLEGNKDNPVAETAGLIKDGDDLANELHKIALKR